MIKTIPKKKKRKKPKWFCEEPLQIAKKKRKAKEERKDMPLNAELNAEFQRIATRDNKAFLSDQCKEIEENNRMGKTSVSSRKLEIPRENVMQRRAQ